MAMKCVAFAIGYLNIVVINYFTYYPRINRP